MAVEHRSTLASLFFALVLSGCSTITTEPPKNLRQYAEIDAVVHGDTPEVTIHDVAMYTGFSSRYFFTGLNQKEPKRVFLSPGTYSITVSCSGSIYMRSMYGEPIFGPPPPLKFTVEGGKKYLMGCEQASSRVYLDLQQQDPAIEKP